MFKNMVTKPFLLTEMGRMQKFHELPVCTEYIDDHNRRLVPGTYL
jgi:hypothetical protein